MRILQAVEDVNDDQKLVLFNKLKKYYAGKLKGMTIALWGLSFKPQTDDMREAPSLVLIEKLLKAGCKVKAYDPVAMDETKRRLGDTVILCKDPYEAVMDADALFLVTEWTEFRYPNWTVVKKLLKKPVVFDGRNIYDRQELQKLDFDYYCIGVNTDKV